MPCDDKDSFEPIVRPLCPTSASAGCSEVLDFLSKLPVDELSAAVSLTLLLKLLVGEEPVNGFTAAGLD